MRKFATIVNDRYLSQDFSDLMGKTFRVMDEFDKTILICIKDKKRAPYGLQIRKECLKWYRSKI
jgi:hypothetical protein